MSKVRLLIQGKIKDYDGFSTLARQMCEHMETEEPGTLAHEWFADQKAGRATVHEMYEDEDAFLSHFGEAQDRGDMDQFMKVLDITDVTILNRVVDPRVHEVAERLGATELHGLAGVVR